MALLLANLRSNFAEFLNNSYLAHLRILSLTTCVRSRYEPNILKLEAFLESWHHRLLYSDESFQSPSRIPLKLDGFAYPAGTSLSPESNNRYG